MIYIATVHWKNEKWIDVQLKYLKKHITEPFKIYTCLHGIKDNHSKEFSFISNYNNETFHINRNHSDKLNYLADKIIEDSKDDGDILIFIDSDAFPITNILPFIKERIRINQLIAVRRDENNGDKQPHPIFCATTVRFWKQIRGDWTPGHWKDKHDRRIADTGGRLLQQLNQNNINWYPLLKTDRAKLHPVWFGIYNNMIYHHGAGSREPLCREDVNNNPKPNQAIMKESKKLMKEMINKIQTNEYFYKDL